MCYFTSRGGNTVTPSPAFAPARWPFQIAIWSEGSFHEHPLSLLCVHGVGHAEIDAGFQQSWSRSHHTANESVDQGVQLDIDFVLYDDLFDKAPAQPPHLRRSLAKLLGERSGSWPPDLLTGARGITDIPAVIKWTAGMVAQWSTDEQLREDLRQLILDKIEGKTYDVSWRTALAR